ncbi:MAG: hypothetical protein HY958_05305 [Bacteroidia bacterium]|nr:hypothetical protein [Bacteroidia bacterium]
MKSIFIIAVLLAMYVINGMAQEQPELQQNLLAGDAKNPSVVTTNYKYHIGLGFGMDYGGFGARFAYLPVKHFAVFAAGGYVLIGFGYNAGISLRTLPDKKICPYISAMYGYNAVMQVTGAPQYNKIYYGPSFSLGFEFRSSKLKNYFNAELLVPIRSQEYESDIDALKRNPLIKITSLPPPVGFSLGYHFVF